METVILSIQAQIFKWVGLFWLAGGLVMNRDPVSLIWQAGAASFAAMIVAGLLMRITANHVGSFLAEQIATEAAEQARAAEQAEIEEQAHAAGAGARR